jgi:hypothetical protein
MSLGRPPGRLGRMPEVEPTLRSAYRAFNARDLDTGSRVG